MSQHAIVEGAKIVSLDALRRACTFIAGAQLSLPQEQGSYWHGTLSLIENPQVQQAGLRPYQAVLRLRFKGETNQTIPVISQNGLVQNGYIEITVDQDRAEIIERVIGVNGQVLMDYYQREVGVDTVKEVYGDNFDFVRSETIVDGIPVLGCEAREKTAVIY